MEQVTTPLEITGISLSNIRGFRELTLDLRTPQAAPRKRTLIIGKNGTCKSTILRAIAIGLSDVADASILISEQVGGFLSRGETNGSIALHLKYDGAEIDFEIPIERSGDKEVIPRQIRGAGPHGSVSLASAHPFVCGYGAGRFGGGADPGGKYRISDSVLTLFRYDQPLSNPELTLRRLQSTFDHSDHRLYSRILSNIQAALGLKKEDRIEVQPAGGVTVSGPTLGENIPLEGLADGYRLTFGWILDLYAWALQAGTINSQGQVEGILLIDEIEQHLHPSMQAEILPRLSELLPKMQIFATTHSPQVALDAKPEELVVLRREGGEVVTVNDIPNFRGYTVEDMLADPRLFDSEVYGDEASQELTEYRKLAAIPKEQRDKKQSDRLRRLATEIRSFEGYSEQENETSRLLKQLMAKYDL